MRSNSGFLSGLLVVAFLPTQATVAAEPDWRVVAANTQLITSVNASNIKVRDGHLMAWVMLDYVDIQEIDGKKFRSVTDLRLIDCAARRSAKISEVFYESSSAARGVVSAIDYEPTDVKLAVAQPESADASVIEFVCAQAQKLPDASLKPTPR